jgi:hypothetical protein
MAAATLSDIVGRLKTGDNDSIEQQEEMNESLSSIDKNIHEFLGLQKKKRLDDLEDRREARSASKSALGLGAGALGVGAVIGSATTGEGLGIGTLLRDIASTIIIYKGVKAVYSKLRDWKNKLFGGDTDLDKKSAKLKADLEAETKRINAEIARTEEDIKKRTAEIDKAQQELDAKKKARAAQIAAGDKFDPRTQSAEFAIEEARIKKQIAERKAAQRRIDELNKKKRDALQVMREADKEGRLRQASMGLDETEFDNAAKANAERARLKKLGDISGTLDEGYYDNAAKANAAAAAERARLQAVGKQAYAQMGADRAAQERIAIAEGRVPPDLDEIEPKRKPRIGNAYRNMKAAIQGYMQMGTDRAAQARTQAALAKIKESYMTMGTDKAAQERIRLAAQNIDKNRQLAADDPRTQAAELELSQKRIAELNRITPENLKDVKVGRTETGGFRKLSLDEIAAQRAGDVDAFKRAVAAQETGRALQEAEKARIPKIKPAVRRPVAKVPTAGLGPLAGLAEVLLAAADYQAATKQEVKDIAQEGEVSTNIERTAAGAGGVVGGFASLLDLGQAAGEAIISPITGKTLKQIGEERFGAESYGSQAADFTKQQALQIMRAVGIQEKLISAQEEKRKLLDGFDTKEEYFNYVISSGALLPKGVQEFNYIKAQRMAADDLLRQLYNDEITGDQFDVMMDDISGGRGSRTLRNQAIEYYKGQPGIQDKMAELAELERVISTYQERAANTVIGGSQDTVNNNNSVNQTNVYPNSAQNVDPSALTVPGFN